MVVARRLLLFVVPWVMMGCAHYVYRHPDYTPQKWATDSYECERDVRQSRYYGTGISAQLEMGSFYDRCLAARGWVKTRVQ